MYKLNLHAHTQYSDGGGTIKTMAEEYRKQGFSCAVITDHWYTRNDLSHYSMTYDKFLKAIEDAKQVQKELDYPVIIGVEYGFFCCEEVLCFGRDFIHALYKGVKSIEEFGELRKKYPSVCVLCHPGDASAFIEMGGVNVVDGYELYNSGQYMFSRREVPKEFKNLTAFSNSDAHGIGTMRFGYNFVNEDIKSEEQLIKFINKKKFVQPHIIDEKSL